MRFRYLLMMDFNKNKISKELIIEKNEQNFQTVYREKGEIVLMDRKYCGAGDFESTERARLKRKCNQYKRLNKQLLEAGL